MFRILVSLMGSALILACSSNRQFSSSHAVVDEKLNIQQLIYSINDYFENTVPQIADSVICAVDYVLSKVENDTAKMKVLTRHIFDKYLSRINSNDGYKMMGLENVVIHIIDNYYLSGKVNIDNAKFVNEIAEYANKNRATLIGQQAKNLKMETISGGAEALYDIDSPYILLCFFDASCAHCRYEIPEIYKIFREFKNKGLSGFCVYTRDDKKEWLEFVSEYKLTDWINAWDPANENDFRIAYSLYYIPQVYVLDKDKKIVGHRLESASLSQLLDQIIK